MISRFTLLAAILIVMGRSWDPPVSLRVRTIITVAVLGPGVAGAIFHQIRLRKALPREQQQYLVLWVGALWLIVILWILLVVRILFGPQNWDTTLLWRL